MKTCIKTSQTLFKKKKERQTYQMLGIASRVTGNKTEKTNITLYKYVFAHKMNTVCSSSLPTSQKKLKKKRKTPREKLQG